MFINSCEEGEEKKKGNSFFAYLGNFSFCLLNENSINI